MLCFVVEVVIRTSTKDISTRMHATPIHYSCVHRCSVVPCQISAIISHLNGAKRPSFGIHSEHAQRGSSAHARIHLSLLANLAKLALCSLSLFAKCVICSLSLFVKCDVHPWQSVPSPIQDIRAIPRKVCVNICVKRIVPLFMCAFDLALRKPENYLHI